MSTRRRRRASSKSGKPFPKKPMTPTRRRRHLNARVALGLAATAAIIVATLIALNRPSEPGDLAATATPEAAVSPSLAATPGPTATPEPTAQPTPSATAAPTATAEPTAAPAIDLSGINLRTPGAPVIDDFDRDTGGGLGRTPSGLNWRTVHGQWRVRDGTARLEVDSTERSVAVLDLGLSDATVTLTLATVQPRTGLVFRFVDRDNYWVLIATPSSSTWNLKKVVDGEAIQVGNTGASPIGNGVVVTVRMDGPAIEIDINEVPQASFSDDTHQSGGSIGLTATGQGSTTSEWDDLVVIPG